MSVPKAIKVRMARKLKALCTEEHLFSITACCKLQVYKKYMYTLGKYLLIRKVRTEAASPGNQLQLPDKASCIRRPYIQSQGFTAQQDEIFACLPKVMFVSNSPGSGLYQGSCFCTFRPQQMVPTARANNVITNATRSGGGSEHCLLIW